MTAPAPPRVGDPAPGLTLPSTEGSDVRLGGRAGAPSVLVFLRHVG